MLIERSAEISKIGQIGQPSVYQNSGLDSFFDKFSQEAIERCRRGFGATSGRKNPEVGAKNANFCRIFLNGNLRQQLKPVGHTCSHCYETFTGLYLIVCKYRATFKITCGHTYGQFQYFNDGFHFLIQSITCAGGSALHRASHPADPGSIPSVPEVFF